MSALRKIAGMLVAEFVRIRAKLAPSLVAAWRRAALVCRSRWFVPCVAVAALAAVGIRALVRESSSASASPLSAADGSASASSTVVAAQGGVLCREAVWDFGVVDNTKTPELSHRFTLENVSSALVKVDKVEPGCGCIVAKDFVPEIPGNSTAGLPVTVNLAGPPRPFWKQVTIHLLTTPPSRLTLGINGIIDASPAFYSAPATVDFGTLGTGETRTRAVKITRFDGSAVAFVRGVPQSGAVSLESAVIADDRDSVVELTLSLNAAVLRSGEFASSLLVQTEHATHPEFTITIKGRISRGPDGLVRSVFARKLRRGTARELPLTSEAGSPEVEGVSYEGAAPVVVELVQSEAEPVRLQPIVRIVRKNDVSQEGTSKVVSGHLLVMVSGRDSPVRIPMFVQLTD